MSLLARAELGLLAAQAAPGLGDLHALAGAHCGSGRTRTRRPSRAR
jgi:hypothetical protein